MCAKSLPLVSVIVPVYNGCRYLAEALGSIFHQRYEPVEIIMVDDGSTDGSAEVAKSFGSQITYIFQENQGTAAARNLGERQPKDRFWPSSIRMTFGWRTSCTGRFER